MRKKIQALICLSLYVSFSYAQNATIRWNETDKPGYGFSFEFNGFIGGDETGIYYLDYEDIVKLDNQGKLIQRKKLEPVSDVPKMFFYPRVFMMDGRLWLVAQSGFDKKEKATRMYAQEIDKASLNYKGQLKTLVETHGKGKFTTPVATIVTPVSKDFLCLEINEGDGKYLKVFSSACEVLREKIPLTYEDPDKKNLNSFSQMGEAPDFDKISTTGTDILVDSAGDVYINCMDGGNCVLVFPKGVEKPIKVNLDGDGHASVTHLRIGNNGELVCAGFCMGEGSIPQAIRYARINPQTGQFIVNRYTKLDGNMLEELEEVARPGFFADFTDKSNYFQIAKPVIGNNSDVFLTFYRKTLVQINTAGGSTNGQMMAALIDVDYREIVAVHITAQGDIAWQKKLPRWLRVMQNRNSPCSLTSTFKDGKYYVLYADDADNISKDKIKDMHYAFPEMNESKAIEPTKFFAAAVVASIDEKGNLERKVIQQFDEPFIFHPQESYKINSGTLLVPGYDCSLHSSEKRMKKIGLLQIQ